jgi:hypothetical protein
MQGQQQENHPWWRPPETPYWTLQQHPPIQTVSPSVPFIRPVLPVLPDLAEPKTVEIAEATRQIYANEMDTFKACNLTERTIIQQANTTIDEVCLANLIDDNTGLLEGTIPEIMRALFET